jgi:hypothetical protein
MICYLGSTASGSWNGVRSVNGNDQRLGLSNNNTPSNGGATGL